ncbi:Ubiquinone/menaquinone biosynthesis C-methyltransferase UbiE [bacterium HR30]|nr:Ubiquinone/menaquinone biosynthesis C-methyltransferase UbiE [bacterium HR30]
MDEYTRRTRAWLDEIYSGPPPGFGSYVPHSPIHGLSLRSQYLGTYVHLYAVLRHLSKYEFSSVLDLGAGEGFLARMIEDLFRARCVAVDLSVQACRRARERIGNVVSAEALHLPFRNKAVDVAVSVNTLEHVRPIQEAVEELQRTARNLIVVALPHARSGTPREAPVTPHAHVSMLTRAEMQLLFGPRARIYPSLSRLLRPFYAIIAEDDVREQPRYQWLKRLPWNILYAAARMLGRYVPRATLLRWLCRAEYAVAQLFPWWTYESIVVVELEGARHRRPHVPSRVLLDALLRPHLPRGS